jgi:hypothetical protein
MRNTHGEDRTQAAPRQEAVDVMGKTVLGTLSLSSNRLTLSAVQCYNCHTTATPLWRKDDKEKIVCNAYVDSFGFGLAIRHNTGPSYSLIVADYSEYIPYCRYLTN